MTQPIKGIDNETTEILYGAENIIKFNLERFSRIRKKHDAILNSAWPSVIFTVAQPIKIALMDLKKKGIRQRLITEITSENVTYCKELTQFTDEIRHLDGIKGNFSISDEREYVASATVQKEQGIDQLIFSNARQIVEQHQYLFETLWDKAIPAEDKIKEIEQGIKPEIIKTIKNPMEIQNLYQYLIKSSTTEVLLMIPTTNAMHRQTKIGLLKLLNEVAIDYENNVHVRILAPIKNSLFSSLSSSSSNINLRNIETSSSTKSTILIVDRKESLVIEVKDDTKDTFINSIGFATYSNSRSTVLSYVSIFESFWLQTEMYKKVKETEQMQNDFINIAAHELRNPIQPILSAADIVRKEKVNDTKQKELLDVVMRNATKLKQLTEDILDVSKIENNLLHLNKEEFNLNKLISDVIHDDKSQILNNSKSKDIKLSYEYNISNNNQNIIIVFADKNRLQQVISNLISNSIKFSQQGGRKRRREKRRGIISVNIQKEADNKTIVISVKDTGKGIDHEILPRLFTKFATKSEIGGIGLGLFISKNIIEAHGGKIWAKNNSNAKGATFYFSLPL